MAELKLPFIGHGGDYNPDQWRDRPDILAEDIRLMKLARCNLMSVGIFAWATLEHFQRTRGVLRLMAAVIHELWMANDASAMIMPGSFPLDIPTVKDELVRYLPETWNAIIDSEVDGKNAIPYTLDKSTIRYGQKMAARRVSRTIMLGSAPTVRAQNIRGIEASRIRLGVVQPGENIADFNDALNTLRGSLSYLYADPNGNRYWYDTRPTLRKTASDRSSQMASSDVEYEIEKRLRDLRKEAPFAGLHVCPASSSDVSDEQAVRLVILRPSDTFKQGKDDCAALRKAEEILNTRGSAPRTYRNINVDLPWNPTRLEQRKGRIQRIGQLADTILIYNMRYKDSVEDKVHKKLSDRLQAIYDTDSNKSRHKSTPASVKSFVTKQTKNVTRSVRM